MWYELPDFLALKSISLYETLKSQARKQRLGDIKIGTMSDNEIVAQKVHKLRNHAKNFHTYTIILKEVLNMTNLKNNKKS